MESSAATRSDKAKSSNLLVEKKTVDADTILGGFPTCRSVDILNNNLNCASNEHQEVTSNKPPSKKEQQSRTRQQNGSEVAYLALHSPPLRKPSLLDSLMAEPWMYSRCFGSSCLVDGVVSCHVWQDLHSFGLENTRATETTVGWFLLCLKSEQIHKNVKCS